MGILDYYIELSKERDADIVSVRSLCSLEIRNIEICLLKCELIWSNITLKKKKTVATNRSNLENYLEQVCKGNQWLERIIWTLDMHVDFYFRIGIPSWLNQSTF